MKRVSCLNVVIDSHIHIDQYRAAERQRVLDQMEKANIAQIIAVATNLKSAQKIQHLAIEHDDIKPAYGYHPEQAFPTEKELDELFTFIKTYASEMVAIGEVGLPYYSHVNGEIDDRDKQRYIELLEEWIMLAKRYDKPLNLHAIYEDAAIVCNYLERYSIERAH